MNTPRLDDEHCCRGAALHNSRTGRTSGGVRMRDRSVWWLRTVVAATLLAMASGSVEAQESFGEHPDRDALRPTTGTPSLLAAPESTDTYTIRVVYLIPSNREPQPDAEKLVQRFLLRLQTLYRENLQRLGYPDRALRFETIDGVPAVHVALVAEPDSALHDLDYAGRWNRILNAASRAGFQPFARGQVLLVIAETHRMLPDGTIDPATNFVGGTGLADGQAGAAVVTGDFLARARAEFLLDDRPYGGLILPGVGPFPLVQDTTFAGFEGATVSSTSSSAQGAIAHELAHAFGLPHDFRNDENFNGNLLGNGLRGMRGFFHPDRYPQDDVRLSSATVRLLEASRFFGGGGAADDRAPFVSIVSRGTVMPVGGQLRVDVFASDETRLRALVLLRNGNAVADALVDGTSVQTTLDTYDYAPGVADQWEVVAVDAAGNRRVSGSVQLTPGTGFNRAPVPNVRVTKRRVTVGEEVILDASRAFDPDGPFSLLQVEWDVDGDGRFDTPPSFDKTFTTSYTRPGTYQVMARIVDAQGDASRSMPIGVRVIPSILNDLVSFEPGSTRFLADAAGCPAGYAGRFSFDAVLSNVGIHALAELAVEIARLTPGNLLLTDDGLLEENQLFSIGAAHGSAAPFVLPGQSLTIPFSVCLEEKAPFQLLVNVRGTSID